MHTSPRPVLFSSAEDYRNAIPALRQARLDLETPHVIGAILMIREAFEQHPIMSAICGHWHGEDDVELVFEVEAPNGELLGCHMLEAALRARHLASKTYDYPITVDSELLAVAELFPDLTHHGYCAQLSQGMASLCHVDAVLRDDAPSQHLILDSHGPSISITRDMDLVQIAQALHATPQVVALMESAALAASATLPTAASRSRTL